MRIMREFYKVKYNLTYNCVIVIQSLFNNERATGKELYEDIISRRCDKNGLLSYYKEINTRQDFFTQMHYITDAVINRGHYPLIHFEIHGNEKGFRLNSGEDVLWEELTDYCRRINVYLKNGLSISLGTCKGASMYSIIDIRKPAPFWAIIGPKFNIYNYEVIRDFSQFYDILLDDGNLDRALESLNLPYDDYKYAIISSETIFDMVSDLAEENAKDESKLFNSLKSQTKQEYPHLNRNQRRQKLKSDIKKYKKINPLAQYKKQFLML